MTIDELVEKARELGPPPAEAAAAYAQQRDAMAAEINRRMGQRQDLDALIGGEQNRAMMEDNHRNHARFMAALFAAYDPKVFVETVCWVYRAYRQHGFGLTYWPAQLDNWLQVMKEMLPHAYFVALEPYYLWMLTNSPAFAACSDAKIMDAKKNKHV